MRFFKCKSQYYQPKRKKYVKKRIKKHDHHDDYTDYTPKRRYSKKRRKVYPEYESDYKPRRYSRKHDDYYDDRHYDRKYYNRRYEDYLSSHHSYWLKFHEHTPERGNLIELPALRKSSFALPRQTPGGMDIQAAFFMFQALPEKLHKHDLILTHWYNMVALNTGWDPVGEY